MEKCEIVFIAEYRGEMRSSIGRLEALESGRARLTGIPTGGPYTLELADAESSLRFDDIYAGDVWSLAGQSNMEGAGTGR